MTFLELARMTEEEARTYVESHRWPNGPVCSHCQSQDRTRLNGKAHRPGTIQCNACREQFTVTVGSVMESSKIALLKWVLAFHLMCSSKKGMSALQLQRELGLGSYKSAWFLCHRIRLAMKSDPVLNSLGGILEADETYVGARKPRHKGDSKKGRGTKKSPVMVLVERDGRAYATPIDAPDGKAFRREMEKCVDFDSILMTDEWQAYNKVGREFTGGHFKCNHGHKEYVRRTKTGDMLVTTNTAENFFALMKRGHYGVYHVLSKKHLHRYCAEYEFRWNHRKIDDAARTDAAIQGIGGKRLMYETPV